MLLNAMPLFLPITPKWQLTYTKQFRKVVNLLKLSIERNLVMQEPLNLAQGKGYTIRESIQFIARTIGFDSKLVYRTDYPDGAAKKIIDTRQFQQFFGNYQFVNHYDAICKTVDYYRSMLSLPEREQEQYPLYALSTLKSHHQNATAISIESFGVKTYS
jgi:hypothetical protein